MNLDTTRCVALSSAVGLVTLGSVWYSSKDPNMTFSLDLVREATTHSKLSGLVMINFGATLLYLLFKMIIHTFFDELKELEKEKLRETCINYALFKSLFMFGLLGLETREDLWLWLSWFVCLGFLKMLTITSENRFEYMSVTPDTPRKRFLSILSLLLVVFTLQLYSLYYCLTVFHDEEASLLILLEAEVVVLLFSTVKAMFLYGTHLYDLSTEDDQHWEDQSRYIYLTHFLLDMIIYVGKIVKYLHILTLNGMSISMVGIVVLVNLRQVVNQLNQRQASFFQYRKVMKALDDRFPTATEREVASLDGESCAICLTSMTSTTSLKKLPCQHFFHRTCLRRCFEKEMTQRAHRCPICRQDMIKEDSSTLTATHAPGGDSTTRSNEETSAAVRGGVGDGGAQSTAADIGAVHSVPIPVHLASPPPPTGTNAVLNEDNAEAVLRISSDQLPRWFPIPRFSFEIIHRGRNQLGSGTTRDHPMAHIAPPVRATQPIDEVGPTRTVVSDTSTLNEMLEQVRTIFPQWPETAILSDLRRTGSANDTIDRILSGQFQLETYHSTPSTTTTTWNPTTEHTERDGEGDSDSEANGSTVDDEQHPNEYSSLFEYMFRRVIPRGQEPQDRGLDPSSDVNLGLVSHDPRVLPTIPDPNEPREIRRRRALEAIARRNPCPSTSSS